jgi:AcrR family transcriptional regulator
MKGDPQTGRLPRGRHGLSREYVARNQRDRLTRAAIAVLYEEGYDKTTVAAITRRASVSKSDFYKSFQTKDDCLYGAYDEAVQRLRESVKGSGVDNGDWGKRIHTNLATLLTFLANNPAIARLVMVEGFQIGRGIGDRHREAIRSLTAAIHDGAPDAIDGRALPQLIDEAVVSGTVSLITQRILEGETEQLHKFLPEIAEFALSPYLGVDEARRAISS